VYIWFFICILAVIAAIPLHFLSVEHLKLQEKYGKKKGKKIGEIYGLISGWSFFFFWMGIWFSPQPRFTISPLQNLKVLIPVINLSIPLFHLVVSVLFIIPGIWIAINGVKEVTLKVAETHRADKIIITGVYSIIRHPQYLGGLLVHIGISFLFSAWYSLLFTPLMIVLIYFISKKEEIELFREFGKEYDTYKKKVRMFLPKHSRRN
jgi:protein-S-isoprenylcysteine O-methyltransferase Ste14